ncbi:MAG: acyl-CoA thioesterase [Sphingobacteriales bacterium]|jgi:acyl-CoA thioester hydrolase|nr:acyl-CoA thioesterase [Sphingobacteriales bacterium]
MFESETKLRVRYGETDQMGYVYYGNYAEFYEVARVEMLRKLGLTYKWMEGSGIMMPVLELKCKYIKPAYYDDEITIKVIVKELPKTRIIFNYELYNEQGELINLGETTLVFVNIETKRPTVGPEEFMNKLKVFYE